VVLAQKGPVVLVQAAVPAELEQHLKSKNAPVPRPVTGPALVDSGASLTMLDHEAVDALGVAPAGSVTLGTAGGTTKSVLYPVRLGILYQPNQPPTINISFARVAAGPLKQQGILCLLGRDVLRHALFVYDGAAGSISLAF